VDSLSAGSLHSLFLTKSKKLFGCGKNSKGQLGFRSTGKGVDKPIEIKFGSPQKEELMSFAAGSLFSMALCRAK
jgi:alpha-tubulin suppressor-like RCC1 family protein